MADANDKDGTGPHEITIVHLFDAPRELVFRSWVDPAEVQTWFAPDHCTVTFCEVDARPGGKWRVEYRYDFGGAYIEYGEFHEVLEPEKLAFSLTQEDDAGNVGPRTLVTVQFADKGARTEMTFQQTGFETSGKRDNNTEGWKECFRKLEAHMANRASEARATERGRAAPRTNVEEDLARRKIQLEKQQRDAESQIKALIERWANAVQRQDIATIVADHATNLLMFDVPPPNELNGIDAYRESWTPFFEQFKHGGVFAIERLDVTAGDQVAFATALLRCGSKKELEREPTTRLRLTVGLRKEHDRWIIAHEHHSFPYKPT